MHKKVKQKLHYTSRLNLVKLVSLNV